MGHVGKETERQGQTGTGLSARGGRKGHRRGESAEGWPAQERRGRGGRRCWGGEGGAGEGRVRVAGRVGVRGRGVVSQRGSGSHSMTSNRP
jgi:hypothetical protein